MRRFSVIICCHNSVPRLERTLQAVCAMEDPADMDWEIVVVDNASTDGTADAARGLLASHARVDWRVVFENTPGLMHARCRGTVAAAGEAFGFIDDDNWPDPDWLRLAAGVAGSCPQAGAWGGWCSAVADVPIPAWFGGEQARFACGRLYPARGLVHGPLYGAGLCVRRTAWEQILPVIRRFELTGRRGGILASGDDDFICRLILAKGMGIFFEPALHIRHFMPESRLSIDYVVALSRGLGLSTVSLRAAITVRDRWPMRLFPAVVLFFRLRAVPRLLFTAIRRLLRPHDLHSRCEFARLHALVFHPLNRS
jgi:glycosyltransferase involved in cell wall biosynthesis